MLSIFFQIVPFLLPWLSQTDIKTCRILCKEWSLAIDRVIQYQPSLNISLDQTMNAYPRILNLPFGPITFRNCTDFNKFIQFFEGCPSEHNPFPSRWVVFQLPVSASMIVIKRYWLLAQEFLHRYGQHIWYIQLVRDRSLRQFVHSIQESLCKLPNLKSLDLVAVSTDFGTSCGEDPQIVFPHLPELDTLRFDFDEPLVPLRQLSHSAILVYSQQLRRLVIDLEFLKLEYVKMFPNLTELSILEIKSKKEIGDLLGTLEAPHLTHLYLTFTYYTFALDEDIFPSLSRFPGLESLHLIRNADSGCRFVDKDSSNMASPRKEMAWSLPVFSSSLKSLVIDDSPLLSYNFLLSFPSLQTIRVRGFVFHPTWAIMAFNMIRKELRRVSLYQSKLWERIPNLKKVARSGDLDPKKFTCFSVEMHHWLKETGCLKDDVKIEEPCDDIPSLSISGSLSEAEEE